MTGRECYLGEQGASAKNEDSECSLHGRFDVWVMQDDKLLISDLGLPSEEPKQCLALGINQESAKQVVEEKSKQPGTMVVTTERKCFGCGRVFWFSEHETSKAQTGTGRGYFCPDCLGHETEKSIATEFGNLAYWCG